MSFIDSMHLTLIPLKYTLRNNTSIKTTSLIFVYASLLLLLNTPSSKATREACNM